jgi:electron transfer flavoprotein alpha subunit
MAVLVIADHDNAVVKDNTHKTVTAALALSGDVDILVAGKGVDGVAAEAAKIAGVRKVLVAESDALGKQIAEAVAARCAADGGYDAVLIPATSVGQELRPAHRRQAGRGADLRDHRGGQRPTPSCGRSMPATRWRRSSPPTPRR